MPAAMLEEPTRPGRRAAGRRTRSDQSSNQAPAMPAAMLEELLEQVLLRIPPDDPARLVRAALVSKRWCRLICGRRFRRQFREFHGTPPLLGFFCNCQRYRTGQQRLFVPTSSFRPRDLADHGNLEAVHSYHGRVLLCSVPRPRTPEDLFVWDPITDKLRKLPISWSPELFNSCGLGEWNAAALCCGVVGDGCDHLDCHHGPFMVVYVGTSQTLRTFACVYSSESDMWGDPVYTEGPHCQFVNGNSVLVGSVVYFKCCMLITGEPAILKYDLLAREVSSIHMPRDLRLKQIRDLKLTTVLLPMEEEEDGSGSMLGFAFTTVTFWSSIYLWSRKHGPGPAGEDAIWADSRVIELDTLLQTESTMGNVVAFAGTGAAGVVFVMTCAGLFSVHLKSGSYSKMPGDPRDYLGTHIVVPYFSFCTPALGAVSIEEGPGTGEPSA